MLIGGNVLVKTKNSFGTVWLYNSNFVFTIDIHQNIWRRYPDIPFEANEGINLATGLNNLATGLNIDKLGNR